MDEGLKALRAEIEAINRQILALLSRRGGLAKQVGALKDSLGIGYFDPLRESEMLCSILEENQGPFNDAAIAHLFQEIFRASTDLMGTTRSQKLHVHRAPGDPDAVIDIAGIPLGGGHRSIIAGPCSIESEEQLFSIAEFLHGQGIRLLRAGAYKPRTSPYAFQGLGAPGWEILRRVADHFGMKTVSEVVDTRDVENACRWVDVLQIGARSMQNFELLRLVGQTRKPVLLKRGMAATLEEFILAAEYIVLEGNRNVILCERGIRTFETSTRNTLDISAVPILKGMVPFPVVVDLSHSAGRRDIVVPLGRAALAAGADAVMVETHPHPSVALSDSQQQLSPEEFRLFQAGLMPFLNPAGV
jgi:3-deoxy-7-phosphoheptulonate synthase/chorismate mutase